MKKYISLLGLCITCVCVYAFTKASFESNIVSHIVDTNQGHLQLVHLDDDGNPIGNFSRLKSIIESKGHTLKFAMNGGMYLKNQNPQGLYIEKGKVLNRINLKTSSYGNFYMKPNGVN